MKLVTKAYSKINLHLEVLNKRPDGYHNIFSLMTGVGLYDLLKLEALDSTDASKGISVEIHPAGGACSGIIESIPVEDNLIFRALYEYFNKIGKGCRAIFSIEKNIPAGAGLGGGSSDAAGVLRLLNQQMGSLTMDELLVIAGRIGADVPFCVNGGYALCEGIGNRLEYITGSLDYYILIANDDIHVNTAQAYHLLGRDAGYSGIDDLSEKKKCLRMCVESGKLESCYSILRNDFEEPVYAAHPDVKRIRELVFETGPDFVSMTGSGSSIIGVFREKELIQKAERFLRNKIKKVIVTRFVNVV